MKQSILITYENGELEHACLVYESIQQLKTMVEELSKKLRVKSVELLFGEM